MGEIRKELEVTEEDDLKKLGEEKEKEEEKEKDNNEVVKQFIFLYEWSNDAESVKKFYHQMGATDNRKAFMYMRSEEERKKKKPILHSL